MNLRFSLGVKETGPLCQAAPILDIPWNEQGCTPRGRKQAPPCILRGIELGMLGGVKGEPIRFPLARHCLRCIQTPPYPAGKRTSASWDRFREVLEGLSFTFVSMLSLMMTWPHDTTLVTAGPLGCVSGRRWAGLKLTSGREGGDLHVPRHRMGTLGQKTLGWSPPLHA